MKSLDDSAMNNNTPCQFGDLLAEFLTYTIESQRLARAELLAEHKIGAREYFILKEIASDPPISFRELVDHLEFGINSDNLTLGIDELSNRSTTSQIVSRLEKRHLVTKEKDPQDQRQPLIRRTPDGDKIVEEVSRSDRDVVSVLVSNGLRLDTKAQDQLTTLMADGLKNMAELRCSGKANRARVYDYLLNGHYYLPVDEVAAKRFLKKWPNYGFAARQNRAFQRRAVKFVNEQEHIRQFADIGAGMPSQTSTHDVLHDCQCNTVYVDSDPDVVHVGQYYLRQEKAREDSVIYIDGDLRDPDSILWNPGFRKFIDLSRPVGVILGAVLHYVEDDEQARRSIATLAKRLPPGSCFIVSHATYLTPTKKRVAMSEEYQKLVATTKPRTADELRLLFTGMELIGERTGPVYASQWCPEMNGGISADPADALEKPEDSRILVAVFRNGNPNP